MYNSSEEARATAVISPPTCTDAGTLEGRLWRPATEATPATRGVRLDHAPRLLAHMHRILTIVIGSYPHPFG